MQAMKQDEMAGMRSREEILASRRLSSGLERAFTRA